MFLSTSVDSWNGEVDQCQGASVLEIGMVGPRRRRSTTVGLGRARMQLLDPSSIFRPALARTRMSSSFGL